MADSLIGTQVKFINAPAYHGAPYGEYGGSLPCGPYPLEGTVIAETDSDVTVSVEGYFNRAINCHVPWTKFFRLGRKPSPPTVRVAKTDLLLGLT